MLALVIKSSFLITFFLKIISISASEKCEIIDPEASEISIRIKSKQHSLHIERKHGKEKASFSVVASPPISHKNCYLLINRIEQITQNFLDSDDNYKNLKSLSDDGESAHSNDKHQPAKRSTTSKLFRFFGYSAAAAVSVSAVAFVVFNWPKVVENVRINTTQIQITPNAWCSYSFSSLFKSLGCT